MKPNRSRLSLLLTLVSFLPAPLLQAANLTDYGAVPLLTTPNEDQNAANQKLDFHTDLFTGRFAYAIPIEAPPARGGSQPSVALQYNSADKNGWCGVGWDLDLGNIQRDTRLGVPVSGSSYDDSRGFTFSVASQSGRLISVGSSNFFPQINTAFLKFTFSNGWWVVTDKSGRKYNFGETTASRITNSFGTFKWALSSIRDPNGNKTLLTYTSESSQLYLQRIDYNANDNSQTIATNCTIAFDLEAAHRADTNSSVISGAEIMTTRRLGDIRVLSQGQLVRRYHLDYTNSPSTGRSLLQKVTQFGSDNTSSLPPHTFTYQVQSQSFESKDDWKIISQQAPTLGSAYGTSPATPDAQLIDINGDGLPDWVTITNTAPFTRFQAQLNTRSGFSLSKTFWSTLANEGSDTTTIAWNDLDSVYCHFLDLNGDMLPDRVMRKYQLPSNPSYFQVQLNNGSAFGSQTTWTGISEQNGNFSSDVLNVPFATTADGITSLCILSDINGDGFPDRVMLGSSSGQFDVQLNQIGSFAGISPWGSVVSSGGPTTESYYSPRARDNSHVYSELIDLNGDGLPDRIIKGGVQLNNGVSGFGGSSTWSLSSSDYPGAINTTDGDYTTFLVDINGDGLPDLVSSSGSTFSVRVNTGRNFSTTTKTWSNVSAAGHSGNGWQALQAWDANGTRLQFADLNGDGLPDRVIRFNYQGEADDYLAVQLNTGPLPDLLAKVENGIGGSVSVSYLSSTEYDNSDGTRSRLPFPVYTVSAVTNEDGHGNVSVTSYSYAGGYYDTSYRELRGFAVVTETDPLGAYTTTWFHQGGATNASSIGEFDDSLSKAGMPFRVERYGSDDKLYARTLNKVQYVQLHANGVFFPFVQQTIRQDFEGNSGSSNYRASAAGYAYSATSNNLASSTGNLLGQTNYGEVLSVNISAHTFTTTNTTAPVYRQYAYASISGNADIIDRVASATVSADGSGSVVLQQTTNSYYATTGNIKTRHDLCCPGTYAVTGYSYDAYGNSITVTNPVGIVTTTDYDSATATYPVRRYTGALANNLVEYTQYDPRSGAIVNATNMQGLVSSNAYDVFLRLTNTLISTTTNGAPTLSRTRIEYNLGGIVSNNSSNWVRVLKNDPADAASGYHETYTYLDGLGRPIQTREEAEANGYRVSNISYDERGSLVLQEYPFFASGSGYAKYTSTRTNVYTEYDKIGRAYRVSPVATATFSSSGWWNGNNPTVSSGESSSALGQTSVAFKDGTNPWAIIVTNALGKLHKYYLDAFGRTNQIVEVTSQGDFSTSLAHDQVGNLTNITDNAANQISLFYDAMNRCVAMADPDMGFWQWGYDLAGRLKTQTDAKGNIIQFGYNDPMGRLTTRLGYNTQGALSSVVTNVYDTSGGDAAYAVSPGQLYKVTDDEGWQKFSYDTRGRTLKTVRYLSKNGQTYTNQFTYDDADRLSTTVYPSGGPTVTNIYDTGENLCQVKQVGGVATLFYDAQGFDELSRARRINFGNGVYTTNIYYSISKRLSQIVSTKSTNVQSLAYSYDAIGNLKSITDGVHTSGSASATFGNITYDDLNRLTSLTNTSGTFSYAYDSLGNVLTNKESGSGTYIYNPANRPHAVTNANGVRYLYDPNGNVANRGGMRLVYDVNNRMISALRPTIITQFGYDGGGARLWKSSNTNSLQVWIGNLYEEKNGQALYHIYANGRLVCTFDSTGTNVFQYYQPNNITSTSVQTDQNGVPIQHYEYFAFGQTRFALSTTAFPVSRRYTSQVLDDETGLYYYNARYYDPQLGRFIQPDEVISALGDPQSYNRYSYVLNNPLKYTDPDGRAPQLSGLTYDATTGRILGGYTYEKFGDSIRIAKSQPPERATLVLAADTLEAAADATYDPRVGKIETAQLYVFGVSLTILGVTDFIPESKALTKPITTAAKKEVEQIVGRRVAAEAAEKVETQVSKNIGRSGKQARLRQLAEDPNVSSADRGWIRQDLNQIERETRDTVRVPPGKQLAHERGREAAKGYGYEHSNLQDIDLHRTQHKFDDFGRANKERPPIE